MRRIRNSEIARVFRQIGELLSLKEENPFRVRAYQKASQLIEVLPEQLCDIAADEERDLTDLQGIGRDLSAKITELLETGKLAYLEKIQDEVPIALTEILKLEGLGPRKVAAVHDELGVESIDQLEEAIMDGRLGGLDGFGAKSAEKILRSIELYRKRQGRFKWATAEEYVEDLTGYLGRVDGVSRIAPTGSYRRCRETIGDIDILVGAEDGTLVMDRFAEYDSVEEVIARGETKSAVRLRNGLQVDLRAIPPESFGAGLQYFTGSQAHNVQIRSLARKHGLKVNEYGVFRGDEKIAGEVEEDVYAVLGIPFVEPELREGLGEVEAGLEKSLPALIQVEDIRGDLQMHSTASDGKDSIEGMAVRARDIGYEYIAITDHSRSETQAGGLKVAEVQGHLDAIDAADREVNGIRILKGMEVDILKDGSLDYPDDILDKLDVVVVSVHSHFSLSMKDQTRRIVRALENPHVQILAHPTGRLIQKREPYEVDMKEVMEAAKAHGVALELNAFPDRLDLKDVHCRMAREMGVRIVISTDAHSTRHLGFMRYGISNARRGWIEKGDVLNTLPLDAFLKELRRD